MYEEHPESFHARLVTGDETWIHHWDPDTKQESMQWKHPCSPPPKKSKTQPSAGKVMATVFWDPKGVLMVDYKPAGKSITGAYYADLMKHLRTAIKEKRRGKLSQGVLLLHDNAPVHKSRIAQTAIRECKFEQLNHPPYSPDLVPSDYYLYRNLKSHLLGTRFPDGDNLKDATEAWFEEQTEDFYFKGIDSLKDKWAKCIEVKGIILKNNDEIYVWLLQQIHRSMNFLTPPRSMNREKIISKAKNVINDHNRYTKCSSCSVHCKGNYHNGLTG